MKICRIKAYHNALAIICILMILMIISGSSRDSFDILSVNRDSNNIDENNKLKCAYVQSIFGTNIQRKSSTVTNSTFPKIIQQDKIGMCINFNYDPDDGGNSLRAILAHYSLLHRYIVILTPSTFSRLSIDNQALLNKYGTITLNNVQSQTNQHVRLNVTKQTEGNIFHMSCPGTTHGFYQHICLSLCAQFFQIQEHVQLRGALYIPDDIFFNFTTILMDPAYYNLDEFWMSPSTAVVDASHGMQQPSGWYWWKENDNWNRLHDVFFVKNAYFDILSNLYGPKRVMTSALADILYIPVADNQMKLFINVTDTLMTLFPNVFCEIILPIVVDVASSLAGHWPYKHDRTLFHSKINRLNNISNIQELEKQNRLVKLFNPLNVTQIQQRPCLLNVNGSLWNEHRESKALYRYMLFTGRSPFLNDSIDNQIDYIHPMKLSNNKTWQYQLWHEAMQTQTNYLFNFQLNCFKH